MRLGDTLARRRCRYTRPIPTLPDLMLIDVPPVFAASTLALGRYYPVIVETDDEWREWESFIAGERGRPIAPDLFDRRPSRLVGDDISFADYDPPSPGWPWILLCRWPPDHVALIPAAADAFARAAYTIEILPDAASRAEVTRELLASLQSHRPVSVIHVPPASCQGDS